MHTYKITALKDCEISGEMHLGHSLCPFTGRNEAILERGRARLKAGDATILCLHLESLKCTTPIKADAYIEFGKSPKLGFLRNQNNWPASVVIATILKTERESD